MPVRLNRAHGKPEDLLDWHLQASHLPTPVRQFRATPPRKFAWDFAWPALRLLVDVQGGTWKLGGHSSGTGIARDAVKLNLATLAGYRVLLVTTNHVQSGQALAWIEQAIRTRSDG